MTMRSSLWGLISARASILRLMPRAGFGLLGALLLLNLLLAALPIAFVITSSVVLGKVPGAVDGGLDSTAWRELVPVFAAAAGIFVLQQVLAPAQLSLGELLARRIDGTVVDDVMRASTRSTGVGPMEDQSVLADLRYAARELEHGLQMWGPGSACAGTLALIARYGQLVGYTAIIGVVYSWWAALAVAVTVLWFRNVQRGGLRRYAHARFSLMPQQNKVEYVRKLAVQAPAGKEIRVFGLANWMDGEMRSSYRAWFTPLWAARRRVYLWPGVWSTGFSLLACGAIFATIGATAINTLTLTEFVLIMQAALGAIRLSVFYPEADLETAIGTETHRAVRRFSDHIDRYTVLEPTGSGSPAPEPVSEIHFDDVSFHYPGQDRPVLDGLDLRIPVGSCTAIVGLNGAGKTTLVKLLARLYEPDRGAVRLDGVDIRTFELSQWRARLAVIFQDYLRYEFSAADNVAFGAVGSADDRDGVREAVAAMGLTDVLNSLPRGLDTPLAAHVTGGAELSGGQWQRLALARALFALRHGASVVVLDEPTASLDVRAEAQFFDQFAALTQGATTLLISHRFSTVRHADKIVVLHDGRVSEEGSHDQLLARNGRYAELFRLQANRFADNTDSDRDEVLL